MPGFPAVKSFTNNKTNSRNKICEGDYIRRKKSETIYDTTTNNINIFNKSQKENDAIYEGPFFVNGCKALKSVGGFNINSYDLFFDITKGKYLIENKCPSLNQPKNIERTYKISEGTFYNQKSEINENCEDSLKNNYDVSYTNQFQQYPFSNYKPLSNISLNNN